MEPRVPLAATVALLAALVLPPAVVWGTESTAAVARHSGTTTRTRLDLLFRLGSSYDSNVLDYSNDERTAFLQRNPASRFALRSLDDAVFGATVSAALSRRLWGRRESRFYYAYTRRTLARNPIDDSYGHFLSFSQPIHRNAWASLAYLYRSPGYVRHLLDVDFTAPYTYYPRYQAAYVERRGVRLEAGTRIRSAWSLAAGLGRFRAVYNPAFRERSAREWELEAGVTRRWSGLAITAEPSLKWRRAQATDPAHPGVPDSLREDTSFHGAGLALNLTFDPGRLLRIPAGIELSARYRSKAFTSRRPADLYHHHRRDRDFRVGLDVERQVRPGVSLFGGARYQRQTSSGALSTGAGSDPGAFHDVGLGGGIKLSWSHALL